MSEFLRLKGPLKRGALIVAANWPVVLVQFVAEATFKLLLGVPLVGGAVLVTLVVGRDLGDLLRGDARSALAEIGAALIGQPVAFGGFVAALAVMVLGGSIITFLVKGGTVAVLSDGEARAGAIERPPLRLAAVQHASTFSIDTFVGGCRRLFRRYLRLGLVLFLVYGLSAAAYLAAILAWLQVADRSGFLLGWTVVVGFGSSALVVWITLVNLVYLLLQMVMAIEDCGVREAVARVAAFLGGALRDVALVFIVVLSLVVLATAASMLATAGLGLISFVPLIGLAAFPLQAAAWLVRGLVFQYLGLAALGAYIALYRQWRAARAPQTSTNLRTAP